MLKLKTSVLAVSFLAFTAIASADSITVQLGSGVLNLGPGIPDQVQEAGAVDLLALTLNVASTQTFYTALYGPNCTTCTGTLSGNLKASLIITDSSPAGTGNGIFSQGYTDSISGGTHTFTPLASTAINIALLNGDTLTITPLAGAPDPITSAGSEKVDATFLLHPTSSSAVPEPSSAFLLLTGIGVAGLLLRRKVVS